MIHRRSFFQKPGGARAFTTRIGACQAVGSGNWSDREDEDCYTASNLPQNHDLGIALAKLPSASDENGILIR